MITIHSLFGHEEDPLNDHVPAGQGVHTGDPALEYVPAVHAWHEFAFMAPGAAEKVPAVHNVHEAAPANAYEPMGHGEQMTGWALPEVMT